MEGMVEENGTVDPLAPSPDPPLSIASSVQSVIQPNQQSVIQTAANLQPMLSKGNVILVGKPNSVIQTTQGSLQTLQVVEAQSDDSLSEDESPKKRRDLLTRRPSYRKILNDLGGGEIAEGKVEQTSSEADSELSSHSIPYHTVVAVIPAGAIQISSGEGGPGIHTLTMTNSTAGGAIVQYAQGGQEFFVPGLSARDFILQWRHKALLLFKLLLLEKRVIFYRSPVQPLCSAILTLLSLHPLMIEKGLEQSACVKLSRPMSPMPDFSDDDSPASTPIAQNHRTVLDNSNHTKECNVDKEIDLDATNANLLAENHTEIGVEVTEAVSPKTNEPDKLCRDVSTEAIGENVQNNINLLSQINLEQCGVPLSIFSKGCLCLPYLSLPYLDLLSDMKVRGYVVGATNILFKQKRQLSDVLVDIENSKIECQDIELRKQLHLTTEDLRFADYIVKHVSEEKHDVFLDGVGWEGGDEWIRAQFKIYLLYLLKTSCLPDGSRELEHFNVFYMAALKETHNYKMWRSNAHIGLDGISCGHPFAGQLSVSDMKLRLAHTMQNTEGGRKLNQAMASTGRVVATTSKAVGGALSQAKGAFSNWWSNLLVSPDVQKGMEATNENINDDENSANIIGDEDQSIDSLNMHLANGSIIHEENKNCSKDSNLLSIVSNVNEGFVENDDIVTGKVHIV